jgi:hypothetical protein
MAEKMPIRIREVARASGGTYDYVKSKIVPPGEIWCLQGTAYENETAARGTFRRLIEGHGYDHFVAENTSPGAGEIIFTDTVLYLIPGERLSIRQASCHSGDILALYAHGYKTLGKFLDGAA